MGGKRYVVIVALGLDEPDMSTLKAFMASGTDAISYHPGVWHHPLLCLDQALALVFLLVKSST